MANAASQESRTRLQIKNTTDEEQTIIIEPWGPGYALLPGETCAVVGTHPTHQPWFQLEAKGQQIVVWVESTPTGEGSYEFWHEGKLID